MGMIKFSARIGCLEEPTFSQLRCAGNFARNAANSATIRFRTRGSPFAIVVPFVDVDPDVTAFALVCRLKFRSNSQRGLRASV